MTEAARRAAIISRVQQNRARLATLKSRLPAAVQPQLARADSWNTEIEGLCRQQPPDPRVQADPEEKRLARAEWQLKVTEEIIASYEAKA